MLLVLKQNVFMKHYNLNLKNIKNKLLKICKQ